MEPGGIRLNEVKFNVVDLVELQLIENAISALMQPRMGLNLGHDIYFLLIYKS